MHLKQKKYMKVISNIVELNNKKLRAGCGRLGLPGNVPMFGIKMLDKKSFPFIDSDAGMNMTESVGVSS